MKYKCERCNELQANLDNMFTICTGIAKYVDELEEQRKNLKIQLAIEVEAKVKLVNEKENNNIG